MLWLPDRQALKLLAKQKRKRRRRRIARLLLFGLLLFGLTAASAPTEGDLMTRVAHITEAEQFDFVDWISQALVDEVGRRVNGVELPPPEAEQLALVEQYLALETEIRQLKREIEGGYAVSGQQPITPDIVALEQKLAILKAEQQHLSPQVETIFAHQIETILKEEGFTLVEHVLPPVAFRLIDPPTALILSPRDKIQNQQMVGLQPGLSHATRFDLEADIESRGDVSSYISNIGGLGSFPTMVINTANLVALVDIAVHEWTHNYFFTFVSNMAWGYQTYPRLTTINETTATMVGKEVAHKVITRYYPAWIDDLPPSNAGGVPVPRQPSEFDQAMRRIRQQVDTHLAAGEIGQAEAYMEAERLKLVEKGYNLRKLNQAYFAFHGSYAFGPASVDPTGQQLRQLRAASPSLKAFVDRVGGLNSYDDFLLWLNEVNED